MRSAGPRWPWRSIPRYLQRRWAPCGRAHGQGQGQLPLRSIRPRVTDPARAPQLRRAKVAPDAGELPDLVDANLPRSFSPRAELSQDPAPRAFDARRRPRRGQSATRPSHSSRPRSAWRRRLAIRQLGFEFTEAAARFEQFVGDCDGGHDGQALIAHLAKLLAHRRDLAVDHFCKFDEMVLLALVAGDAVDAAAMLMATCATFRLPE